MQPEHEELMRSDFQDRTALTWQAYKPDATEQTLFDISRRTAEYDQRWLSGPHAEHWQFLTDAYSDWRARPDTMGRFLDNLEHNRRTYGDTGGFTETQRQSLIQAGNLAREEQACQRLYQQQPQRDVERWR
ncbi:hypothetical protein [Nocardia huaxiensis]|uniref:Uncharacterized protein n=1 Tax=Nocardia huaxiensis TaxID=2755382 RepID=A0A7D6VDN1_9NOCA|nr:hypothetical protein [Nocardia huaxiensis]QLY34001.1 hypothetical protein H0264_18755 [Nocardia huaxiensis]UFS99096.1 hypothetical protein LPY97_14955 [Nocardia huaxiensis]